MPQTDYSLRFPYGKNHDKTDLTHELGLDLLASHYDYRKTLYQDQMTRGHTSLLNEIKVFKQVSIYTHIPPPPNFLSVFSSAIADKRVVPYAYLDAIEDKKVVNSLYFENFRVTQYRAEVSPAAQANTDVGEDPLPDQVWIMLMAKNVM